MMLSVGKLIKGRILEIFKILLDFYRSNINVFEMPYLGSNVQNFSLMFATLSFAKLIMASKKFLLKY